MKNGDYQSCQGCNVYATCSNEILYDNRPCPAGLVWDDNKKRCEYTSDTCNGDANDDDNDDTDDDNNDNNNDDNNNNDDDNNNDNGGEDDDSSCDCVDSCTGMPDGNYQSCHGCNVFATCSNGLLYDKRPCPAGLVWDDNKKRCEWKSDTCTRDPITGNCVSSCIGMKDGDYQSCKGCNVYASCSNEILYDNRPCPANLVWDDNKKICDWTSETCHVVSEKGMKEATNTGDSCIESCQGLADGNYQSCQGCSVYASCSNEILIDNRPCPGGLVWDDNLKRCESTSATCTEPASGDEVESTA